MRRLSSGSMISPLLAALILMLLSAPLQAQQSPHGTLKNPCTDCHTTASWKELAAPMKFSHSSTGFVLQGTHANTPCLQCHTAKKFAGTPSDCFSCHTKDFSKARTPDHQAGQFSRDCTPCHTLNGWRPSIFDHAKTNFQLVGAHASVECSSCHVNERYKGLPNDCFQCHQKEYLNTRTPDHSAGRFSRDCLTCHSMDRWQPLTFDHQKSGFPLSGAHAAVDCASCHRNGVYTGTSRECYGCHQQEYAATTAPGHAASRFDRNCLTCHTVNSWTPSTFDHARTQFPLNGAHVSADCAKCHANGLFAGTPRECYPCHQRDAEKTVTPNHVKGQFSNDCRTCHTNNAWKPSTFDHGRTNYPLVGAHRAAECSKCHVNDRYTGLTSTCYACHQSDYLHAEVPSHSSGQFSRECLTCHSMLAWKPSTFDHAKTEFPLRGGHVSVDCASCHSSGQFKGLPSTCYSCHAADFASAVSPNHTAGQFSHDCLTCHSNAAWKPATFNHNATLFPLTGAHGSVPCASCHTNGQYATIPSDCYSCHQDEYAATNTPNHVTSQFSRECLTCHTTSVWKPSTFNHASTAFPLLGAHAAVSCTECHSNGQYKGTSTDCYVCHQSDYTGVADPNHVANNFDHRCLICHTVNAWEPATFNHAVTSFPLTGAHVSAPCASCHAGGKYAGTTTDCYQCHISDFTSTINPAHVSAGYPKACLSCHTTTAWKPSTFNHTPYFPIGAGDKHRPGRWTTCLDCHTSAASFKVFSCITCHEHNKTSMDDEHRGKAGYIYDSNACYKCHPTGRG